jgi:hypothetical protein
VTEVTWIQGARGRTRGLKIKLGENKKGGREASKTKQVRGKAAEHIPGRSGKAEQEG